MIRSFDWHKFIVSLLMITLFSACVEEPVFTSTPVLDFIEANYVVRESSRSFEVTFNYQDQEGDIFTNDILNDLILTLDSSGTDSLAYYRIDDTVRSVTLNSLKPQLPRLNIGLERIDDIPTFATFSDCDNDFNTFLITDPAANEDGDLAFLVRENKQAKNLKLRFFALRNGEEVLYDTLNPDNFICSSEDLFDTKINQITDPNFAGAKEGELTYILNDNLSILANILRTDSFKIKLWLIDDQDNMSNIIESPGMILPSNIFTSNN